MRTSSFYLPIQQTLSNKDNILSYNLMLKTGMIRRHVKGIYSWLPFGTLVLRKLENLIRNTLNSFGMQECIIPCLQSAELWKKTNRYDAYGKETFRLHDRHNKELLLAPTSEDLITEMCKTNIKSYKDLPVKLYEIQWKFRDEIRPKNGAMRAREFIMKDGYSFDIDEQAMNESYKIVCKAYYEIFNIKLNLNTILNTAENGPIGGKLSHEVSILSDIGENLLEIDPKYLKNNSLSFDEWYSLHAKDIDKQENYKNHQYTTATTTEVGHIFAFDQKYTKLLNFQVSDINNKLIHPYMTSFGIGVTRLLQLLVEKNYNNNQLSLPSIVNPFKITIIDRNTDNINGEKLFQKINTNITNDILFDNKNTLSIKDKIANHKLLGAQIIIIISQNGEYVNIIDNIQNINKEDLSINNLTQYLNNILQINQLHQI